MIDDEFLDVARRLAEASKSKPRQADLRRSISTAYYAVFHAVARTFADTCVGTSSTSRSGDPWMQAYRTLDHRAAASACRRLRMKQHDFTEPLVKFAGAFCDLQEARHRADYDPSFRVSREDAVGLVAMAATSISALKREPLESRRAFAIFLTLRQR